MARSATRSARILEDVELPAWIAGEAETGGERLTVTCPYDGTQVGSTPLVGPDVLDRALDRTRGVTLSRFRRYEILEGARALLAERAQEFSDLILSETGLAACDTASEVGRAQEALRFAAHEALREHGEAFAGDVSAKETRQRIFTMREPVRLVAAITPFNYPLNQIAHKVAPAIAAGAPVVLKPSEKAPLTALRFTELLYEAGLPGPMLSALVGPIDSVVEPLVRDERVEVLTFTGSADIGRRIASIAGYKRLCLELGGNSPVIVLPDADLELAVGLAADESFRHSGQRCTSAKRLLVHEDVLDEFTARLTERAASFPCGDPRNPDTRVGTQIDLAAAERIERTVTDAVEKGARILCGGERDGALYPPTVLADVPRGAQLVREETFGPLAPILAVCDVDDAIELANATRYGLACTVMTDSMTAAMKVVRGVKTGQVNVNAGPGFRTEPAPFGGVKDSGLGVKEGVAEAVKLMTNQKTFSLPW